MRILRILGFLSGCLTAWAQPAGTSMITGVVVEASGDASAPEPVRKAEVTVTWHGTPRSWATTRTDGSGRFQIGGLPAGVYDLRATKSGAGVAIYGANSPRETGETITLADGETREGLKLRFIRSASISGGVTGPDGDPAVSAQVFLMRISRNNGPPFLQTSSQAQTNDRGEYQMAGVEPGQYYVFATVQGDPVNAQGAVVAGTFYGGTRESKESTVVSVHDGDRLRGIDFHLTSEPAVRIQGHVAGVPAPPTPPPADQLHNTSRPRRLNGVRVIFAPVSLNPVRFYRDAVAQGPDHQFQSTTLPAGEYRVRAILQVDDKIWSASQIVDARSGEAEVTLTLAPSIEVKGQVRTEGTVSGPQTSLRVTLAPVGPNGAGFGMFGNENQGAQAAADGKFTIPQVPPGLYNLNLPVPRGGFLKSVRLGDDEVRFKPIEIKPGSEAPLNIVVSMHGAKVEGEVDAAGGDPGRAGILVTPMGELHDFARFYYSVAADDHGKFKLLGLAPGKYRIFALEKLTATSLRNPEAADQLIALDGDFAQEIELVEDGSVEAHPKLIPLERGRAILP